MGGADDADFLIRVSGALGSRPEMARRPGGDVLPDRFPDPSACEIRAGPWLGWALVFGREPTAPRLQRPMPVCDHLIATGLIGASISCSGGAANRKA
jgi:hypothetical protein